MRKSIAPFGYFSSNITMKKIIGNKKSVLLFTIYLGPPVIISKISVTVEGEGKKDPTFKKVIEKNPLKQGGILNTILYQKLKNQLYSIAANKGYFDAVMRTSQIHIYNANNSASINIVLNTGIRYRFGKTVYTDHTFSEKFLNRFLKYQPGEYYSNKKIAVSQQNLSGSSYFQQSVLTPEVKHKHNGIIPIEAIIKPVAKRSYTLGAGYGTDTGIRAIVNYTNNYTNPYGNRLKIRGQAAENNSNAIISYQIPGSNPVTDLYSINAGYTHLNQTTSRSNGGKISLTYSFTDNHWQTILALNALNEKYTLSNPKIATDATLFYPSASWQYRRADNRLNPNNGFLAKLTLNGTLDELSSKTGFFQFVLSTKLLSTIQLTHTRILLRSDIARTTINSLANLPLSLQLFTGGSRSIRGYEYNSLGAGRNLLVLSAEIQQKIYKSFYLAAFYDAGNIGNTSELFKNIKTSTGLGIAWLSPIGMIELDVARPLTRESNNYRVEFSIGPFL